MSNSADEGMAGKKPRRGRRAKTKPEASDIQEGAMVDWEEIQQAREPNVGDDAYRDGVKQAWKRRAAETTQG